MRGKTKSTQSKKINKSDVSIKKFLKIPKHNFGNVVSINYGCAKIIGLTWAKIGEKITCSVTDSIGSVVGIDPKYVTVLFYTNINDIKSNMVVYRAPYLLSRNIKSIKQIFGNISPVIDPK